ncbi:PREDICTED: probable serine/threonine-protein kinase nek3 [Bactrocera latifrons]|nr:PREDICTED: probable serine/threonine-protein kinase nek3 [Bactrocera latifrons]XP_018801256.1 PREDICTED: probable serine/threonine-protein kinase nek3 [Bactrocera latifrons]XP_018801257.1 PREDICTED: probable serine/threonine-protein kinase nek3 [Bactrocera latifrons]XP_018801259.1 PREDICTED: probable serine/threonine-protein kinase nek3 [Bactrocera latifrons]
MRPFKDFFVFKMETRNMGVKFLLSALLAITVLHVSSAETNSDSTPARVLAKQTGAAQFEEERYETHTDVNEHKHHLKKRSSDEDVDYEVYQGVVGRPGIDFPIYPRIPKTTFSCRSFGNGYFADMETDCQVFHICEDGRKISFLCPNGTIFQQSELTCDWWFKVNCLGSPGYYADSAEILNKQRVQRIRPSVPVQGFNIVGGGLNIKAKVNNQVPRPRQSAKPERRFDSNEEPSMENVDFEDLSGEKQLKGEKTQIPASIDNNNNNDETQITAESGSFVDGRRRNSFGYEKPNVDIVETKSAENRGRSNGRNSAYVEGRRGNVSNNLDGNKNDNSSSNSNGNGNRNGNEKASRNGNNNSKENGSRNGNNNNNSNGNGNGNGNSTDSSSERSSTTRKGYNYQKESAERARDGKRGQQRYREDVKPQLNSQESREVGIESREFSKKPSLLEKPRQVIPVEGRAKSRSGSSIKSEESDSNEPRYSTRFVESRLPNTTPYQALGTYSTARRLDTTRSTPFYTPTVPTVAKSKTTEGKGFYIKGSPVAGSNIVASTPNPKRRVISQDTTSNSTPITTLRPLIIGMRYNHESSGEKHKTSVPSKSSFDTDFPVQRTRKRPDSADLTTTSTTPAPTGPTYLPRNAARPKSTSNSGGDDFLFAPQPLIDGDDSVTRNVQDMIKTINMLKTKFDDADQTKFQGQAREGLDIPPSSGPDALVSLAKYFANEQNAASSNSVSSSAEKKDIAHTDASIPITTLKYSVKPIKNTEQVDATTATSIGVSKKSEDIRASLLSDRTVNQYSNLFGLQATGGKSTDYITGRSSGANGSGATNDELNLFPQIGTTGATISQLAEEPDSRKIAHVFSEAISSYLEDPKTFRAQLEAVRPTEPTIVSGKPNFEPVTATDRSLFNSGTAATYLPTESPATASSIAAEINNNFDFSTPSNDFLSTTDAPDTTTYRPRFSDARGQLLRKQFSAELQSPLGESSEHEEFLHGEHTQSFVIPRNNKVNAAYTTDAGNKPTENPWNQISQTDFLDPLTINDGLMKEPRTTTISSLNFAPRDTTTPVSATALRGQLNVLSSDAKRNTARSNEHYTRVGSAEETTRHPAANNQSPEFDSWQELFHAYNLPQESLPSSNGLQRIANKLFGGLNESEALHLKNVMQQAEHNRQVLSLLLLLIQTCDDQNGRALERSRKHLLNALIDMDGKLANEGGKSAHHKAASVPAAAAAAPQPIVSTTARIADTTLRQAATTNLPLVASTTTEAGAWTTTTIPAVTQSSGSIEETTKFEIRVEEPEESTVNTIASSHGGGSGSTSSNSDERALELLKSLYSLASKFTSRR